jgi:hypothetical protein
MAEFLAATLLVGIFLLLCMVTGQADNPAVPDLAVTIGVGYFVVRWVCRG